MIEMEYNRCSAVVDVVSLLRNRTSIQPDDTAFVFLKDGEESELLFTYAQLDDYARAVGAILQDRVSAGSRVLLLYPPGLDFAAAWFGCLYAGMIAVPAFPLKRNRNTLRLNSVVDNCEALLALSDSNSWRRMQSIVAADDRLRNIEWLATDTIDRSWSEKWKHPKIRATDPAVLQYTSGTTGSPKGVVLTHRNLLHNSAIIASAFRSHSVKCGVFWLPSYHDMGLIGGILQPVFVGRPNVLLSPASFLQKPSRWLWAISRHGANVSGGPNFAYDLCVSRISDDEAKGLDLSHWHCAFNGAESVQDETQRKFAEKFACYGFRSNAFYPCYGLAEATLMVSGGNPRSGSRVLRLDARKLEQHQVSSVADSDQPVRSIVGCGHILGDLKALVVNPESKTPNHDEEIGEIWVAGTSVSPGYWQRPAENEEVFEAFLEDGTGPFMRTGDLGFFSKGDLFVTGRRKDLMIFEGRNHYPQDIERTVSRCHPSIRDGQVGVFSISESGSERLIVVCEVEKTADLDEHSLFQSIREQTLLEHDLRIQAICLLRTGTIPKTSSGKIQRHACKRQYLESTLTTIAKWHSRASHASRSDARQFGVEPKTRHSIEKIVLTQLEQHSEECPGPIDQSTSLCALGLDSIKRMQLFAELSGQFEFPVLVERFSDLETVGEIVSLLEETSQQYSGVCSKSSAKARQFRFEDFEEVQRLDAILNRTRASGLSSPFLRSHEGHLGATTVIAGEEYINFSSFNYLGLASDPRVMEEAKRAIDEFGTSVGASRLVSGDTRLHTLLEQELATFLGVESSLVLPSGFGANESTIGHLMSHDDLIVHDSLAHKSIQQGAILSGATRRIFPHNDWAACESLISSCRDKFRRVMIAIEGVYSMDGDISDLRQFVRIRDQYQALLYLDTAHCLGVLGQTGRGLIEHAGIEAEKIDVLMGTISKSLGSCGGFIAGSEKFIAYLKYTLPAFVFATGATPSTVAAARGALRVLQQEPDRLLVLHRRADMFLRLARQRGLNTGNCHGTPIIPIVLGCSQKCLKASHRLFERKINVQPILHPAVEENAARLRFFITYDHTEPQIEYAIHQLEEVLAEIA